MEGIYTREDILRNIHELESGDNILNYARNVVLAEPIETSDTNEELARKNGLNYSERFNIFFINYADKSRYIESLYKKENDTRTNDEIASVNGVYYSPDSKGFFESQEEYELLQSRNVEESVITPVDIVEADKHRKISKSITDRIKNFFSNIIEKIKGKGER